MTWTAGASSTGADTGPPGRSPSRGGATLGYSVYFAASLDDHLGVGEKILIPPPPALGFPGAGFLLPMSLYSPPASRRLCAVLRPAGGIFAPVASRAGEMPKSKTAVKAIYRPYTAFCALVAIPIFPHRKTAHSGRHRPAQGIKQPRPAPLWREPGHYHLFRARESTAQRSAVLSYQAQRGPRQDTQFSISTAPADAHPAIMIGQSLSAGLFAIAVSFIVASSKKSFHSCLTSRKSLK